MGEIARGVEQRAALIEALLADIYGDANLVAEGALPAYVTGGITASGGAWNASIVAEVVSFGSTTLTAAGLGAYISEASESGNQQQLLTGVIVMSVFVLVINRMLWKRLYALSEKRYSL